MLKIGSESGMIEISGNDEYLLIGVETAIALKDVLASKQQAQWSHFTQLVEVTNWYREKKVSKKVKCSVQLTSQHNQEYGLEILLSNPKTKKRLVIFLTRDTNIPVFTSIFSGDELPNSMFWITHKSSNTKEDIRALLERMIDALSKAD